MADVRRPRRGRDLQRITVASRPTRRSSNLEEDKATRVAVGEGRRQSRFVVTLPVRCARLTGHTSAPLRGRTADVGGGGLAVELPTRLPPGTRVVFEIRTGIGPLRMEAEVVWTRRVDDRVGVIRHGLCLAGQSEILELPIHVLLGQWLRGLAKHEEKQTQPTRAQRGTRERRGACE